MELKEELESIYNKNKTISTFLTSSDDYIEHIVGHQPQYIILEESYEFVSSFFLVIQILKKSANLQSKIYILSDSVDPKLEDQIRDLGNERVKIISLEKLSSLVASSHVIDPFSDPEKNSKIIYISENKFMHFVIKDALKDHKVTLIECLSPLDGIQKAELFQPDLIITDNEFLNTTGFDICSEVQKNPEISHIPVVIYSSNSDQEFIEKAFEVGAKSYIVKKFHHENLAHKILRALK